MLSAYILLQNKEVKYTVTKLVAQDVEVKVGLTVSSAPIPGVQPISITSRVNEDTIEFTQETQVLQNGIVIWPLLFSNCVNLFNTLKT